MLRLWHGVLQVLQGPEAAGASGEPGRAAEGPAASQATMAAAVAEAQVAVLERKVRPCCLVKFMYVRKTPLTSVLLQQRRCGLFTGIE